VGDKVYAIGNPLGVELRGTLTDGIVSAINRDVWVEGRKMTLNPDQRRAELRQFRRPASSMSTARWWASTPSK
jgi:hypothetical protein